MGASIFHNSVRKTANLSSMKEAFREEVSAAQDEFGNGGYTGTIAEKSSVKTATSAKECKTLNEAYTEAERLLDAEDDKYGDKWGPCWVIDTPEGWHFFGWASD